MATPLTAIGKYTGVLTIFLGVLLMFAFVVADPLMQYANTNSGPGGGSGSNEVVARWNGGQMNELQLDQAVIHRNILAEFQQQVFALGYRDAQEDGVEDLNLRIQPLDLPRSREQRVEADVVQKKIFAQKAREAGMVVSDDMVIEYLRALGRDRVSNQQMREILTRMGRNNRGGRATIGFVFDLLREAMLANNYFKSHMYVIQTTLPEEKWDDWKKLNERVVVEAAPIATADFIDEAPEPTDEELAAFYDEYKDRQPSPEYVGTVELPSRLPAFATPPRVKISYLKADFNAAVERLESEITDEQIAEYYEANKESFVAADRALFGDDDPEEETDEAEASESEEEASTEPAADDTAEEAAEDEETALGKDEPASEESTEEESTNPLRQEATEEEEEEEESSKEDSAETADEDVADETEEAQPYQPLEEVSDEIRRRLAMDQAAAQIREKMESLKVRLDDEFVVYFDALLDAESKDAEKPEPPEALANLQPLAEAEQLELIELDQASQAELRGAPIGTSVNANRSTRQPLPLWYEAFANKRDGTPEVDSYEPIYTYDIEGNSYLVLITDRYEAETPSLEEMREQVVGEWKRLKAAELALAKAEEIAKELSGSGTPLADYFAQQDEPLVAVEKVQETDPFSLYTIQRISQQTGQPELAISQPQPLVAVGPELLEGVFDLEAGEVGAELNHNHAIAYVLRIAQKIGTEDELRSNFIRDGDRWLGAGPMMRSRMQNKMAALLRNLLDESGLEELRPLDQVR